MGVGLQDPAQLSSTGCGGLRSLRRGGTVPEAPSPLSTGWCQCLGFGGSDRCARASPCGFSQCSLGRAGLLSFEGSLAPCVSSLAVSPFRPFAHF